MMGLDYISKTRAYLDYLEDHLINVKTAWREVQEKCKSEAFIVNERTFKAIDEDVKAHDVSKFSHHEFTQYRRHFSPTDHESTALNLDFKGAWDHHKLVNRHHWENWTQGSSDEVRDCVHMIVDWTAMGYRLGGTAQDYYETHKARIRIPGHMLDLMYRVFELLKGDA